MSKYYCVVFMGNPHIVTGKVHDFAGFHDIGIYGNHAPDGGFTTDYNKAIEKFESTKSSVWKDFYELIEVEHE